MLRHKGNTKKNGISCRNKHCRHNKENDSDSEQELLKNRDSRRNDTKIKCNKSRCSCSKDSQKMRQKRTINIPTSIFGTNDRTLPIAVSTETSEIQLSCLQPAKPITSCNCGKKNCPNRKKTKQTKKKSKQCRRGSCKKHCCANQNLGKSTRNQSHSKKQNKKNKSSSQFTVPLCPTCSKTFDTPILLSCGHTFCESCVSIFVEASDGCFFACPVCEHDVILEGGEEVLFCPNFLIIKQMEENQQSDEDDDDGLVCGVCESKNEADFLCEQCGDLLCEDCADAHRIVKYTKEHEIKELTCDTNIAMYTKKRYFCNDHENEQLDVYCEKCQTSICRQCVLESHRGSKHNCIPLKQAAQKCRDAMQRYLFDLKARTPSLQLALMDIKNRKRTLRDQANMTYAEISESVRRLIVTLKEHEKKLYKTLENTYKYKLRDLKTQREDVILKLERCEVIGTTLTRLENHDNDVEVLQMKTAIKQACDRLTNTPVEHKLKLKKSPVLFKSNESTIRTAIERHGEIIQINCADIITRKRGSIICDFSDQSNEEGNDDNSGSSNCEAISKAKKMRAKSNWKIVKSCLSDIIKYDHSKHSRNSYKFSRQSLSSFSSFRHQKKCLSAARKEKAHANWLILRSQLNELENKKQYSKHVTGDKNGKVATRKACNKLHIKGMRSRALRQRAAANWLLVRSKLTEIIMYGRVSGRLLFTPVKRYKRSSPTMLKLKYFRAKVVRARANWLLVASRIQDIANYPRQVKPRKEQVTWDVYHDQIKTQRRKATRNKYVAGVLRGRANWMIVKSRLSDIVLFGKYEYYKELQSLAKTKNRCRSPCKHFSNNKDMLNPITDSAKRHPASPTKKIKYTSSNKKENALKNWEKLIRKTSILKRSKKTAELSDRVRKKHTSEISSGTSKHRSQGKSTSRSSCSCGASKEKKARKRWKLLSSEVTFSINNKNKNRNKTLKNWDTLIKGVSVRKKNDKDAFQYHKINKKNNSPEKGKILEQWSDLIGGTSTKNKQLEMSTECFHKWHDLISRTNGDCRNRTMDMWHTLICGTQTKSSKNQETFKHWENLIKRTKGSKEKNPSPKKKKSSKTEESRKLWNSLISGTDMRSSYRKSTKNETIKKTNYDESFEQWSHLISGDDKFFLDSPHCGKTTKKKSSNDVTESFKNWQELISHKASKSPKFKSKQKEAVTKWHDLIRNTTYTKKQNIIENKKHSTNSKQESLSDWRELISGTSTVSKKTLDSEIFQDKINQAKKVLTGTAPDQGCFNDETAETNWHLLVSNASMEMKEAEENWSKLIRSPEKSKERQDKATRHWQQIGSSLDRSDQTSARIHWQHLQQVLPLPNDLDKSDHDKARKHWQKLQQDLPTSDDLDRSDKETARKHWQELQQSLPRPMDLDKSDHDKARKHWHQLQKNLPHTDDLDKSDHEKVRKHWQEIGKSVGRHTPQKQQLRNLDAKGRKHWHEIKQSLDSYSPQNSSLDDPDIKVKQRWLHIQQSLGRHTPELDNSDKRDIDEDAREKATENWQQLVSNASMEKKIAEKNWFQLVHSTKTKQNSKQLSYQSHQSQLAHTSNSSMKHMDDERVNKAYMNWWRLISAVASKPSSSNSMSLISSAGKSNDAVRIAVRNWHTLLSGTELKSVRAHGDWMNLIQGTNAEDVSSQETTALEDWRRLIFGGRLIADRDTKFDNILINWRQLMTLTEGLDLEEVKANWHRLLQSVDINKRELAWKHWMCFMMAANGREEQAISNWEKLVEGRIRKSPEKLQEHWTNLVHGHNPYVRTTKKPEKPSGIKVLYDPGNVMASEDANQPKTVRLNIKNSDGNFNEVHLKMTSPNESLLSAHVQQNQDGTYTIFCCPTVQSDFNISIGLNGEGFKNDANVFSIKGNFSNLDSSEEILAHRTISLIRWHLTPGLLVKRGGRIVAG